jgi:hypothetical protein
MSEIKFRPVPPEPAHPMVVKLHDDLVAIYTYIREKFQAEIDQAFDRVSRDVGFVVSTALPFTLNMADGRIKGIIITDGLRGTIFDRELSAVLKSSSGDSIKNVSAGTYSLYLFWLEALKIKLRTDWMEPAHSNIRLQAEQIGKIKERVRQKETLKELESMEKEVVFGPSPWEEPAHWFDPGTVIDAEEKVLISAIDEVYPELKLVDRLISYRAVVNQRIRPEVKEPAHVRQVESAKTPEILSEISALLHRHGY